VAAASSTAGVLAITGGTAAFTAASSIAQSRQQSAAAEASQEAAAGQLRQQQQQIARRAAIQRMAALREQQRVIGATRVGLSSLGRVSDGSTQALLQQAAISGELNREIIDIGAGNLRESAVSRFQSQVAGLNRGRTDTTLAGIGGGLQGLSTGLSITNAAQSVGESLRRTAKARTDALLPSAELQRREQYGL
tara:strand:- start:277 stop:855 length:579 start_codon:yes stop_codon:yes gene_type:complete